MKHQLILKHEFLLIFIVFLNLNALFILIIMKNNIEIDYLKK
jgi:hypothetical protein